MFEAIKSDYLVDFHGKFDIKEQITLPENDALDQNTLETELDYNLSKLNKLQRALFANDHYGVLLIFQGIDSSGKDSTIRAIFKGVDPAGCQVTSFKSPSEIELDHDFMWRTTKALPPRGEIGVFNRSYYEEILIARVHPELLAHQNLPIPNLDSKEFWQHRIESICDFEKHLARNGYLVLKFWLNISPQEQRIRFLSRLNKPKKHWKFSPKDVHERSYWKQYMAAYEQALGHTSKPWAPWYAIPADNKHYMQVTILEILVKSLQSLELTYPKIEKDQKDLFDVLRAQLENDHEKF